MITINNTVVAVIISTLLAVAVLLSSSKVFAAVSNSVESTTQLVQQLTIDNVDQVMKEGPHLVIMWSLECPACFDELDAITQLLIQNPNLPITLISTDDDPSRSQETHDVYANPAFSNISRWVYSPYQGQQLRYAIDSTWQGELPRSYYIDKNAQRFSYSGLLTEQQLNTIVSRIK